MWGVPCSHRWKSCEAVPLKFKPHVRNKNRACINKDCREVFCSDLVPFPACWPPRHFRSSGSAWCRWIHPNWSRFVIQFGLLLLNSVSFKYLQMTCLIRVHSKVNVYSFTGKTMKILKQRINFALDAILYVKMLGVNNHAKIQMLVYTV